MKIQKVRVLVLSTTLLLSGLLMLVTPTQAAPNTVYLVDNIHNKG